MKTGGPSGARQYGNGTGDKEDADADVLEVVNDIEMSTRHKVREPRAELRAASAKHVCGACCRWAWLGPRTLSIESAENSRNK